jgi:hypothetical protein
MTNNYCLCQDCLKVYPFSMARHSEEEFCSCGGQLCGCSACSADAVKFKDINTKAVRVSLYESLKTA